MGEKRVSLKCLVYIVGVCGHLPQKIGNAQEALGYVTESPSEIYPRGVCVHLDLTLDQRYPVLGKGSYVSYGISLPPTEQL